MSVCCCFGSDYIHNEKKVKERFVATAINVIEYFHINEFHIADHGNSAILFAMCLQKLKEQYPNTKVVRVFAYLKIKKKKEEEDYVDEYFDESIYPELESTPKRFAIVKRNQIMVGYADFIIFNCSCFGNTRKLIALATQKKKLFVNIGDI